MLKWLLVCCRRRLRRAKHGRRARAAPKVPASVLLLRPTIPSRAQPRQAAAVRSAAAPTCILRVRQAARGRVVVACCDPPKVAARGRGRDRLVLIACELTARCGRQLSLVRHSVRSLHAVRRCPRCGWRAHSAPRVRLTSSCRLSRRLGTSSVPCSSPCTRAAAPASSRAVSLGWYSRAHPLLGGMREHCTGAGCCRRTSQPATDARRRCAIRPAECAQSGCRAMALSHLPKPLTAWASKPCMVRCDRSGMASRA